LSGFNFAFAPTVAISHNPQWGRFYETMGDNPLLVEEYARVYVEAL
jgi:beta-glucosidase